MPLQIDNEAVRSLLDGLRRDLDVFAATEAAREVCASVLCGLISEARGDVFERVASPALGADHEIIVLRIRRDFRRHATRCALDRLGVVTH